MQEIAYILGLMFMFWGCGGNSGCQDCRYPLGVLLVDAETVVFDTVALGHRSELTLQVYNPTGKAVMLEESGRLPGVRVYLVGDDTTGLGIGGVEIAAGAREKLGVVFRPEGDEMLGNFWGQLRFFVDGEGGFGEGIYVKAHVRDAFEGEDSGNCPKLVMEEREMDFGRVETGKRVTAKFRLLNEGKRDLLLRKVETSCGCTVVETGKRMVHPGETTEVTVVLDTRDLSGYQRKRVTLYTNDPEVATVVLVLRGTVE